MKFDLNKLVYPNLKSIYEIVDYTNDEMYYSLGVFPDLDTAIKAIDNKNLYELDEFDSRDCGFFTVEIRERAIGWSGNGKAVFSRSWSEVYDEKADEYQWKITEESKRVEA